jgi:hypothetical protein
LLVIFLFLSFKQDGFRKVKSESLQNPNWWEFRHPSFIRGKPQLLSEIKRSMHFVGESGNNGKEISELKSQVANLTEQLNALNDTVEKLTGAFHTMNVHPSASSSSSSKSESSRKKRKASISAPLDVLLPCPTLMEGIELKRMSSLSSTTYVEDLKSSGLSVPTASEFENFEWNDEEAEEGEGHLFEEMCESLIDLEEEQEDPNTRSNSMVDEEEQDIITPLKSEYPPQHQPVIPQDLCDLSDTLSDVSSVIDKLPSDLQLRFVDKLAEVVGSQLANVMTISHDMPIVKAEPIPHDHHHHHHSSHYQQSGSFHYPEYILPSGNKAPEIALPLASAAISAFLLKTFSHQGLVVPSSTSLSHRGDRVGAK